MDLKIRLLPRKLETVVERRNGLSAKEPLVAKTRLTAKAKPRLQSKPAKKQAKPTITKLKREADKWFSKYVRFRDGNECITCGSTTGQIQCGHFMSRRYNATRYEEENCNAQCYRCNVLFYGEQYKYARAVDMKYGDGTAQKLAAMAQGAHPFTVEELRKIIHDAKEACLFYEKSAQ